MVQLWCNYGAIMVTCQGRQVAPAPVPKPVSANYPSPRWATLAKSALGVALAMGVLTTGQAQAFVVNVNGQNWDVTTFDGTYNANTSKFAPAPAPGVMPWWGNESLAEQFANAVGASLGFPITGLYGPSFAHKIETSFFGSNVTGEVFTPSSSIAYGYRTDVTGTYATATLAPPPAAVPGPLPLFGAAAAFGFSRKLRKRINASKCDSSRAATL